MFFWYFSLFTGTHEEYEKEGQQEEVPQGTEALETTAERTKWGKHTYFTKEGELTATATQTQGMF